PRIASAPSSAAGAAAAGRAPRARPPPRRRPDSSKAIRAWSPTGSWPSWSSRASCENERLLNASDLLPAEFNVASWFLGRPVLEGRAGAPAFHCEGRVLSYGDVRELADRTGNALRELGVEMEQRVLMICLDAPEFLGAFWGAIKIGAVPVPVNTLLRAADFRYALDDSRARVAVVSAALLGEAAPALQGARYVRHVLVAGGAPGPHLSFEDRVARASSSLEAALTSRDDVAYWLYSSGSTGRPKGAVHLHHDMVIAAETYAKQVLGIRATDKVYSAAKLFFAYGLGNAG